MDQVTYFRPCLRKIPVFQLRIKALAVLGKSRIYSCNEVLLPTSDDSSNSTSRRLISQGLINFVALNSIGYYSQCDAFSCLLVADLNELFISISILFDSGIIEEDKLSCFINRSCPGLVLTKLTAYLSKS